MAANRDHPVSVRTVRQLRRVRVHYAAGVVLWTASTAWTAWQSPGSRPMWTSALLLVVFVGLLSTTSWWLQCLAANGGAGPQRHAAPRGTAHWRRTGA
ncbi:hypothetical protein [Streptomyces sp. NPDC002588]|uniref:hypothetical protein n=1 Tax=Streptomyces sp. NPDC002588 TaxID=3154419 RepID=UPI00332304AE